MADPLSIIGLVGTAASLTKTVRDYVSAVKDAPKDVENLSRELASLQTVFEHLGKFVQNVDGSRHFEEASTFYDAAGVRSIPYTCSSK